MRCPDQTIQRLLSIAWVVLSDPRGILLVVLALEALGNVHTDAALIPNFVDAMANLCSERVGTLA